MSHNSAGEQITLLPEGEQAALAFRLSGSQAKTAFALRSNAERLVNGAAPGHFATAPNGKPFWKVSAPEFFKSTGFLTLTVGDYHCDEHDRQTPNGKKECPKCGRKMRFVKVNDSAEANRRVNSINRHFLATVFSLAIIVTERHQDGGIHFHLLGRVASGADIRTGLDFKAIRRRDYRTAPAELRALWALLREKLPTFGFGRAELLPIRETSEAVAAYISKYIEKNICNRTKADKRKKLVRYIGWNRTQLKPNEFSWAGARSRAWRGKARETAALIGITRKEQCTEALGPRWALHLSSTWQGRTKDEIVPFLVCDHVTKRLLTNDLAQISMARRPGWLQYLERGPLPFLDSQDATRITGELTPDLFRVDAGLPPDFDAELDQAWLAGWESYQNFEKQRMAEIAEIAAENELNPLFLN